MGEQGTRNHFRKGEIDVAYFDSLPKRCKELFFEFMEDCAFGRTNNRDTPVDYITMNGFYLPEEITSPIEKILYIAFELISLDRETENHPNFWLVPQIKIIANGHKYYADFIVEYADDGNDYVPNDDLNLVIECDGHEFHKATKEQVKHDNERDYDLKLSGYDVLHYSGTQIFEDPLRCAREIYDYIVVKIAGGKNGEV